MKIRIVFDGPPGPEAGRFVEVENEQGQSIKFSEWVEGKDGYWYLEFDHNAAREKKMCPFVAENCRGGDCELWVVRECQKCKTMDDIQKHGCGNESGHCGLVTP